jgi:hypothetical protein
MNEDEEMWDQFEKLGPERVRLDIGAHRYGEKRLRLANQWLLYKDSVDSAEDRRNTLALANDANELARSANEAALDSNSIARQAASSAAQSAKAARISNMIAMAALAAAIIAIVMSIAHMR